VRFYISQSEIIRLLAKWTPTPDRMSALGFYAHQQIRDRHATQGASGGAPWAPKAFKQLGYDDGRAILTGYTGKMLNLWHSYGEVGPNGNGKATVANDAPYSFVMEKGTKGKGGTLPDIVPVRAKALFIPVTDRAIAYSRFKAGQSVRLRKTPTGYKTESMKNTGGRKVPGVLTFGDLVRGRIKNNRFQKYDERQEKYVDGTPDYIFLTRVSIPARPQLPTSDKERDEQVRFFVNEMLPAVK
jgi:hypothetical protein